MNFIAKTIVYIALTLFSIVSIWTTYASLRDSILPKPEVVFNFGNGFIWQCSIFALLLSVAIGLMLFALKMAIIGEEKRLTFFGFIGMMVIASISIAFNMDILYRVANQDFYITYSYNQMRGAYDGYITEVQNTLQEKRDKIRKGVATQEGEFEAEVSGLRQAPAGYGSRARQEDYRLKLLQKTSVVDLATLDSALAAVKGADEILAQPVPKTIDGINDMQNQIRTAIKDAGAVAGIPMPPATEAQTPLFAVFTNLLDWRKIGFAEVFFLALAILLDLGDIVGYSLIPNKRKAPKSAFQAIPEFGTPEVIYPSAARRRLPVDEPDFLEDPEEGEDPSLPAEASTGTSAPPPRPMRFRRRR